MPRVIKPAAGHIGDPEQGRRSIRATYPNLQVGGFRAQPTKSASPCEPPHNLLSDTQHLSVFDSDFGLVPPRLRTRIGIAPGRVSESSFPVREGSKRVSLDLNKRASRCSPYRAGYACRRNQWLRQGAQKPPALAGGAVTGVLYRHHQILILNAHRKGLRHVGAFNQLCAGLDGDLEAARPGSARVAPGFAGTDVVFP